MKIVQSEAKDADKLTEIAKKSKAFWGYSEELIELWEKDLTITEKYIKENDTFHLYYDEMIIGFYSYFETEKGIICLDNLFVIPDYIGKGFGKILIEDFLKKIEKTGYEKITLYAEPNAVLFYEKFGFGTILPNSETQERTTPQMIKFLK